MGIPQQWNCLKISLVLLPALCSAADLGLCLSLPPSPHTLSSGSPGNKIEGSSVSKICVVPGPNQFFTSFLNIDLNKVTVTHSH